MKLWIIGNGFDLHHGLKTRYADYKAFLCWSHACDHEDEWRLRNSWKQDLRGIVSRDCDKCSIHAKCPVWKFNELPMVRATKEDLWRDLEETCGAIDFKGVMDSSMNYCGERGAEGSPTVPSLYLNLGFAKSFMGHDFYDWICAVEETLSGKKAKHLGLKQNDLFMTFNYTSTLQEKYRIPDKRIFNVHGRLDEVEKAKAQEDVGYRNLYEDENVHSHLLFGSPEITDDRIQEAIDYYATSKNPDEEDLEAVSKHLKKLVKFLKKDTQVSKMEEWIAKQDKDLSSLEEVVVAGHSLGQYDRLYFDRLAELFADRKWRFLIYNKEDLLTAFGFCEQYPKLHGYFVPWKTAEFESPHRSADSDAPQLGDGGNCEESSRASGTLAPTP